MHLLSKCFFFHLIIIITIIDTIIAIIIIVIVTITTTPATIIKSELFCHTDTPIPSFLVTNSETYISSEEILLKMLWAEDGPRFIYNYKVACQSPIQGCTSALKSP